MRHGPHQVAQKSTITGSLLSRTTSLKLESVIFISIFALVICCKYQVFHKLDFTIYIKTTDLINIEEEKQKIEKELEHLQAEINRASQMLSNPNFVNKAPDFKVNAEREKLEAYTNQYNSLKERLNNLDE